MLASVLYKCVALWRTVNGLSTAERHFGTVRKEKGISSRFRVSISSRYDLSVESNVKPQTFLPSGSHLPNAEVTSIQSTRTQRFLKPSKPCHVGIHWIALTAYSRMNIKVPGFQSFFVFCVILHWPN